MNNYRSLLLEISNSLTTPDLQQLKFLCGDVISAGVAERITRGFELFSALEQRNMLSEKNRDFLASKLIAIKRNDLRNKLLGIQGDRNVMMQDPAPLMVPTNQDSSVVSDTLLHEIVEELSTSWKMLGRWLGVPEAALTNIDIEQRRVIDKGMAMFVEWKRRKSDAATVRVLRDALVKIGRRDLSEKVRDLVLSEQQARMNTGVVADPPLEERPQFPNFNELRSALPHVPPPTSNTRRQRAPQEQGEPNLVRSASASHQSPDSTRFQEQGEPSQEPSTDSNDASTSSMRVPQFQASSDSISRELPSDTGSTGQHVTDYGPEQSIQPGIQEASNTSSNFGLDRSGCYLTPTRYKALEFLGSGGFAKVYLVVDRNTGKRMACKMCDLGENHLDIQRKTKAFLKEVSILQAVQHRFIVRFFCAEVTRFTLLMFLEYMEGGSVEQLLRLKGAMEEPLVRKFTWQILKAVDYIHNIPNRGIVIHKDIKGANILLDKAQENIKLADFGICTIVKDVKTATGGFVTSEHLRTFHWSSPERLCGKEYSRNTDIWSVACTVVEMLTTNPPLGDSDLDMDAKMYKIVHFEIELPPESVCSDMARSFLKRCFCPKDLRPSASDLLETDAFVKDLE